MLARRASSQSKGNVTSRSRHGSVIANVTLRAAVSIAAFGRPVSVSSSPMRRERNRRAQLALGDEQLVVVDAQHQPAGQLYGVVCAVGSSACACEHEGDDW